jgi:hypothetical protein
LPFQSAGSGIINRGIIKSVMEGNVWSAQTQDLKVH